MPDCFFFFRDLSQTMCCYSNTLNTRHQKFLPIIIILTLILTKFKSLWKLYYKKATALAALYTRTVGVSWPGSGLFPFAVVHSLLQLTYIKQPIHHQNFFSQLKVSSLLTIIDIVIIFYGIIVE